MLTSLRACLEVMGSLGGVAVGTLSQVMARDSYELAGTAAEALGRVGPAAAVLPLQEAAEQSGDLLRVARQAVAEIQSRLEGAVPGQLSLSATDAGQLSLATDPAGQLSVAPHPAGQLSLPHPPSPGGREGVGEGARG